MLLLRKLVGSASFPLSFHLSAFQHFFGRDVVALVMGTALIASAVYFVPQSGVLNRSNMFNSISLYKVQLNPSHEVPDLITDKKLIVKDQITVEQMIEDQMTYTFDDSIVSFLKKDLSLFGKISKAEAEKKILTTIPAPLAKKAGKYLRAILIMSEVHKVDPLWVLSIMWTESHFSYNAESSVGARGLMQIMPTTKKYIHKKLHRRGRTLLVEKKSFKINDYFPYRVPDTEYKIHRDKLFNIELGIIYLKNLLKHFDTNHIHATVAYNMGPSWTKKRLLNNLPVGVKNEYLDKVSRAYGHIIQKI